MFRDVVCETSFVSPPVLAVYVNMSHNCFQMDTRSDHQSSVYVCAG